MSSQTAADLARKLKAMADPVRLRILSIVLAHAGGEACVCDITDAFDLAGPTVSHHLKVLRQAGLVTSEKRGTWVFYRVTQEGTELFAQLTRVPAARP
ncbi:ArsR/SmtB family transcription factor [Nonomuraea africana]|uniref:ArsR family transcriptional regulator n=1 Tax=Nonomuraea africana TaxID=46171 RepID=A0ABR9KFX5_9ACTN|nr:metalloregulator ArsR/SmtB family transcription factor [Nonomuraea africana]MBE1560442.1 ArsR family transcriptional regulator [Nonomuraea africana]